MTFTLSLGWWLAPTLITVAAFCWRWWVHKDEAPSFGYGAIGDAIGRTMTFAAATVVSLLAWLAWSLLA